MGQLFILTLSRRNPDFARQGTKPGEVRSFRGGFSQASNNVGVVCIANKPPASRVV